MLKTQGVFPKRLATEDFIKPGVHFSVKQYAICESMQLHWHEFFEIELILSGRGEHIVNGSKYNLEEGRLFLLTPADFHEVIPDRSCSLELINVKFSDDFISHDLRELLFADNLHYTCKLTGKTLARMKSEFNRLLEEMKNSRIGKYLILKGTLERIIIDLIREASAQNNENLSSVPDKRKHIQRALIYIQHHFHQSVTLEEAAKQSGLTPNYFSECFHKTLGITFKNYLQELRLNFSMSLLKSSSLTVTEICYASGFNSLPHFLRAFKSKFGMSPNTIRRNITSN